MMQRSPRSSLFILLAALWLLAGAVSAQQLRVRSEQPNAVSLSDGVVVDAATGVAYVMNAESRIEALNLTSGTALWTSALPAKPLAMARGQLIAQVDSPDDGRLHIVTFDARTGGPGSLDTSIELPTKGRATLIDQPGRSFRVAAEVRGDEVNLSWFEKSANASGDFQGYLPSAQEGQAPSLGSVKAAASTRSAQSGVVYQGSARVDLRTGSASVAADKQSALPRSGASAPAVDGEGLRYQSANRGHVMVSERDPQRGIWQSYRWTISNARTGAVLGEMIQHAPTAPFVVADSTLIYVSEPFYRADLDEGVAEPMQLRAVDLGSGQELWKREVADPDYVGPIAP